MKRSTRMLARVPGLVLAGALGAGVGVPGSADAALKLYDASKRGGTPGDERRVSIGLCPPVETTPGSLEGAARIADDGLGTVTLLSLQDVSNNRVDVGPEALTALLGPGAFVFLDVAVTRFVALPQSSNTSGIGAHGPSGSAPGDSVEWGVLSGWQITGTNYCVASPAAVCDENGFAHGVTLSAQLPSVTYDLGTWHFDAEGDYEAATWYIRVTSNGGLSNSQERLRGAFVGASLPALPLAGVVVLATGLLVAAIRAGPGASEGRAAGSGNAASARPRYVRDVDAAEKLEALLELARAADLEIRSVGLHAQPAGELPPTSDICRVRDRVWVVLCAADPVERHIAVLADALRSHRSAWLEERWIPPALRELL